MDGCTSGWPGSSGEKGDFDLFFFTRVQSSLFLELFLQGYGLLVDFDGNSSSRRIL